MSYNRRIKGQLTALAGVAVGVSGAPQAIAQVVINEVDYDQEGEDVAEFIELFNSGASPVSLAAFTIELVDGQGSTFEIYRTVDLPDAAIAPGGYYVVCVADDATPHCDMSIPRGIDLIRNGPVDAIALRDGGGTLVDTVSYEGDVAAPYTEGSGVTAGNPNLVYASIGRFPDGTDTGDNSVDFIGACASPGTANIDSIENCCGDGEVNGDEECDEGATMNGRIPCGCQADCTLAVDQTPCAAGECQVGVCDAAGNCVQPRAVEAGTPCGDRGVGDCTDIDTCDAAGNCASNDAPDNQECDDSAELDGCPGLCSAGACAAHVEAGECVPVVCGDGVVDDLEECDDGNQLPGDGCDRCIREDGGGGGCGCRSDGPAGAGGALLLMLLAIRLRRRRR